jgi:DNA-binding transcriptional LysR family regulator
LNRLRLKHWSLLSALGEAATLHQAAARIHVTQPSATKMLADIEQAFGFALFERHARGMRATDLGAEVVAYARRTQAGLDRFMEDLAQKQRGGHGHRCSAPSWVPRRTWWRARWPTSSASARD